MSNEAEQAAQRKANLEEIVRSGAAPYPHRFDRTASVTAIVEAYGAKSGEALEGGRPDSHHRRPDLGLRSFGKANFVVLADGHERVQVYVAPIRCPRWTSTSSSCSTSATGSASRDGCSAPRPTS